MWLRTKRRTLGCVHKTCLLCIITLISLTTQLNHKGKGKFLYSAASSHQDCSKRFSSLTDLFKLTPSQLPWGKRPATLQLMRKGCCYKNSPLSIARHSFRQLSKLEQCRVKKLLIEGPKLYPQAIALYKPLSRTVFVSVIKFDHTDCE